MKHRKLILNRGCSLERDKTIVVSDLHVDTWAGKYVNGETKLEHFLRFLNWIEPFTETFVINGDLFDAPPIGETIIPTYEKVIQELLNFAKGKNCYYFIGNHDIGMWGLRVKGFKNVEGLENLHVIYPYNMHAYVELGNKKDPDTRPKYIYFEHGHYFDPALSLNIYNAAKSITAGSSGWSIFFMNIGNFLRMIFRLTPKIEADAGATTIKTMRAAQKRAPDGKQVQELGINNNTISPQITSAIWKRIAKWLTKDVTPDHWRDSAERMFQKYVDKYNPETDKEIAAIIFGHTHVPSTKEEWFTYKNRSAFYLNSGDWAEAVLDKDLGTHHSNFIIFNSDGAIEPGPNGEPVRDFIKEYASKPTKIPIP